jgi:hypothetical protein
MNDPCRCDNPRECVPMDAGLIRCAICQGVVGKRRWDGSEIRKKPDGTTQVTLPPPRS